MKLTLALIALMAVSHFAYCQNVDYDRIIPPKYPTDMPFPEKLVYLAWKNHPANEIYEHRIAIAEKNKKKASWAWLEVFSASGNLNEFTINQNDESDIRSQFYPRYNFGAHINLEMFVNIPSNIKIAKEEVGIANATLNAQKIALRAEVLRAYQNYIMAKEILSIQTASTESAYSAFALKEQKFKNGEIKLEEYNQALEKYNIERKSKLDAEANFNIAEINIEEYIGIPLEEVK